MASVMFAHEMSHQDNRPTRHKLLFVDVYNAFTCMYFFFVGETGTIGVFFVGLLSREHPKAQPEC